MKIIKRISSFVKFNTSFNLRDQKQDEEDKYESAASFTSKFDNDSSESFISAREHPEMTLPLKKIKYNNENSVLVNKIDNLETIVKNTKKELIEILNLENEVKEEDVLTTRAEIAESNLNQLKKVHMEGSKIYLERCSTLQRNEIQLKSENKHLLFKLKELKDELDVKSEEIKKIKEENKNIKNIELLYKEKEIEIEKYEDKIKKYENTIQAIINDANKYDKEINQLINKQIQNNTEQLVFKNQQNINVSITSLQILKNELKSALTQRNEFAHILNLKKQDIETLKNYIEEKDQVIYQLREKLENNKKTNDKRKCFKIF